MMERLLAIPTLEHLGLQMTFRYSFAFTAFCRGISKLHITQLDARLTVDDVHTHDALAEALVNSGLQHLALDMPLNDMFLLAFRSALINRNESPLESLTFDFGGDVTNVRP